MFRLCFDKKNNPLLYTLYRLEHDGSGARGKDLFSERKITFWFPFPRCGNQTWTRYINTIERFHLQFFFANNMVHYIDKRGANVWIVERAVAVQDVVFYLFVIFLFIFYLFIYYIYYKTCVGTHVLCHLFVILVPKAFSGTSVFKNPAHPFPLLVTPRWM